MLGVVGLVIGGIWVAASAVRLSMQTNQTVNGILEIVRTVQNGFSIRDASAIPENNSDMYHEYVRAIGPLPHGFTVLSSTRFSLPFNSVSQFGTTSFARIRKVTGYGVNTFTIDIWYGRLSECFQILRRLNGIMSSNTNSQIRLTWAVGPFPYNLDEINAICESDPGILNIVFPLTRTN